MHLPPNLEDQITVFVSPSYRMTKIYPKALGPLSVAFCDPQGYDGGILTPPDHDVMTYVTVYDVASNPVRSAVWFP